MRTKCHRSLCRGIAFWVIPQPSCCSAWNAAAAAAAVPGGSVTRIAMRITSLSSCRSGTMRMRH